jgi:L-cystine uptake protein TcyP (sodium:dicarboxylate symporter family)
MSSVALTQKQLESKNHIAIKYDIPLMNYEKKVYTKTKKDHNIMTLGYKYLLKLLFLPLSLLSQER